MIISHRHAFVFVKTRKTAGTSLELALSPFLGPDDVITPVSPEDEEIREQLGGRGPQHCDGLVNHSSLAEALVLYPQCESYFKFSIDRNPWALAVSAYWWRRHRESNEASFRRFLFSRRLRQYSNWSLYSIDGQVAVDRVLRYEQLEDSVHDLSVRFGLPPLELPHAKAGHNPAVDYRDMYGHIDRLRVAQVFRNEIRRLGWRFDS